MKSLPEITDKKLKNLLIDRFSSMYYFEMERKDKINSSTQLPISLVTLAIIALGQYWPIIVEIKSLTIRSILAVIAISTFASFIRTAIYTIKIFFGYTYDNISHTIEFRGYVHGYNDYKIDKHTKEKLGEHLSLLPTTEDAFLSLILDQLTIATTTNTINNDRKTSFLNMARRWTVATMALLLIFIIIYHILELLGLTYQ